MLPQLFYSMYQISPAFLATSIHAKIGAFLTIIWWKITFSGQQVQILEQVYIKMAHFLPICIAWCESYIILVKVSHVLIIFYMPWCNILYLMYIYKFWWSFTCFGTLKKSEPFERGSKKGAKEIHWGKESEVKTSPTSKFCFLIRFWPPYFCNVPKRFSFFGKYQGV